MRFDSRFGGIEVHSVGSWESEFATVVGVHMRFGSWFAGMRFTALGRGSGVCNCSLSGLCRVLWSSIVVQSVSKWGQSCPMLVWVVRDGLVVVWVVESRGFRLSVVEFVRRS